MRSVISFKLSVVSLMLACLWACTPVEKPPQLTFTPGAPFVVTGETFDAGVFRANYPTGWRVISGQASTPTTVIFVAPNNAALIMLSLSPIDAPPAIDTSVEMRSTTQAVALDARSIAVYGTAPVSEWDSFSQTLEAVLASVAR
jgi:hypothetical protein